MNDESLPARGLDYVRGRVGDWIADVGRVAMLVGDTLRMSIAGVRSVRLVVDQMYIIGVQSLALVLIVSVFTGAVAAVQAAYQFSSVVPLKYIGSVILR